MLQSVLIYHVACYFRNFPVVFTLSEIGRRAIKLPLALVKVYSIGGRGIFFRIHSE